MTARLRRRTLVAYAGALAGTLAGGGGARAAASEDFDNARHLLSRVALGATPADISALATPDHAAAVERLLASFRPVATTPPPAWVDEGLAELRRQQKESAERIKDGRAIAVQPPYGLQGSQLRAWWIEEMLVTDQPLVERMVLFWHSHFTSSLRKTYFPAAMYRQNAMFRANALGNFATLLKAVARDPAMLLYLDGVRNVARQPNENFARELLELFTLGEGHYGEVDVREAARAFTGRAIDRKSGKFVFNDANHDSGEKTFLGRSGRFGGDEIVDILLAHPRTAVTIVEKLWREFVSLRPDADEVGRLAASFRASGYEIRPLMRDLLLSSAFRDPANRAALIKSPVDLVIGTVRVLGLPVPDKSRLGRMMQVLGQNLFNPPNVKGWAGGEAWISTHTLLQRQQSLRRIVEATTVSPMEDGMGRMANPRMMEERPIEGRSLRLAGGEARLGPTLLGVDAATLKAALLPCEPIDGIDDSGTPGAVVATALLDPAYQLK